MSFEIPTTYSGLLPFYIYKFSLSGKPFKKISDTENTEGFTKIEYVDVK